jgi:RNA recognition motif-containing protein
MNSTKSYLKLAAVALIGGAIFTQIAINPAVTFVLGVVLAALALRSSPSVENDEEQTKLSTKTLYVGNLPYKANEANVKELFSQYGEVFAVRLMKDKRTGKRRGFGFVVISDADAVSAVEALNEHNYMERTLKVRIANDPKHPESETSQ